jgi:sortase A
MTTRREAGDPAPLTPPAVAGDAAPSGTDGQQEENGLMAGWPEPYPDVAGAPAPSAGVAEAPAGNGHGLAEAKGSVPRTEGPVPRAEAPVPRAEGPVPDTAGATVEAGGAMPETVSAGGAMPDVADAMPEAAGAVAVAVRPVSTRPPRPARPPATGREQVLRAVGAGVLLLGLFVLGLAGYLYGLSGAQEARAQTTMYATLSGQLANSLGPTGPVTPGTPVAVLSIPAIGMRNVVVVEGTSPENLMLGPGHVRDTPLPGQAGVSEIYGRRTTFGAPFGRIPELGLNDTIKVATGQGTATYKVVAFGNSAHLVQNPASNQLILLTAASATVPAYFTYVDADLTSTVQPEPGGLPAVYSDETALSGDNGALVTALLWALALAGVSAAGTFAVTRWSPWPVYLAVAPIALAVLWNLYQSLAALLPNVY